MNRNYGLEQNPLKARCPLCGALGLGEEDEIEYGCPTEDCKCASFSMFDIKGNPI